CDRLHEAVDPRRFARRPSGRIDPPAHHDAALLRVEKRTLPRRRCLLDRGERACDAALYVERVAFVADAVFLPQRFDTDSLRFEVDHALRSCGNPGCRRGSPGVSVAAMRANTLASASSTGRARPSMPGRSA